jgi:uncharacterized lipoprotein YddW (UPF0748 family)
LSAWITSVWYSKRYGKSWFEKQKELRVKRIQNRLFPIAVSLVMVGMVGFMSQGQAQLSTKLVGPDGKVQEITGRNASRGDDALVLYDMTFGKSTRTNPFGVEVVAVPISGMTSPIPAKRDGQVNSDGRLYRIVSMTSVWECAKAESAGTHGVSCGNAAIPNNGIVISATGSKRDWLKTLKPGDTITVEEDWFQQRQVNINAIDPSPTTNPQGSGFPGFRASNQIVAYDSGYGRPNTGTNEFGFEVTVRNGIVTAQEGSDSTIPADGFVLSGHGKGRSWLIGNTPLGAKVQLSPDGKSLSSTIDFDTYTYQFDQRWALSPCADAVWSAKSSMDQTCQVIRGKREKAIRLQEAGQPIPAAATIQEALEGMNDRIWQSYTSFPSTAVRGAWHRPVETTPAAVGQTLDTLKAAGINTVFLETFFHGYTIFPSKTYEAYGLPAENPKFNGVDLLQLWTEEAHKRNMKIHTWFQVFYGGTKAYKGPGPILSKYPSWANVQFSALVPVPPVQPVGALPTSAVPGSKLVSSLPLNVYKAGVAAVPAPIPGSGPNAAPAPTPIPVVMKSPDKPVASSLELGGYFLDPANPDVQAFLIKLSDEIVSRYKIDGFQLDYIRYPASFPADRFSYRKTTWGYTDVARKAFKAQAGIDPVDIDPKNPQFDALWTAWNQYKVNQINNFVQRDAQSIRQINPELKISAAVFPDAEAALAVKHQDWRVWAQKGWIDFFAPMTLTSATKVVDRDTRRMIQVTNGKVPVYSGIFGPFNENSTEQVLSQIDTAKQAGASGYVLFDTAHLTTRTLNALRTVQMAQPKTVVTVEPPAATDVDPKPKKHHWWSRK